MSLDTQAPAEARRQPDTAGSSAHARQVWPLPSRKLRSRRCRSVPRSRAGHGWLRTASRRRGPTKSRHAYRGQSSGRLPVAVRDGFSWRQQRNRCAPQRVAGACRRRRLDGEHNDLDRLSATKRDVAQGNDPILRERGGRAMCLHGANVKSAPARRKHAKGRKGWPLCWWVANCNHHGDPRCRCWPATASRGTRRGPSKPSPRPSGSQIERCQAAHTPPLLVCVKCPRLTRHSFSVHSPLCANGSASVPQSFFTISRWGTNGHLALGCLCESST
jgi:hypothetical protein